MTDPRIEAMARAQWDCSPGVRLCAYDDLTPSERAEWIESARVGLAAADAVDPVRKAARGVRRRGVEVVDRLAGSTLAGWDDQDEEP